MENLERSLAEGKAREQRLAREAVLWKNTADGHARLAEERQFEYESLRDKWGDLHHDKLDLQAEVTKLTKELGKVRMDRVSLQGERGTLKKELEETRQQLINHPDLTIAERAQKDSQIRDLEEENASLKKKLDVANGQLDYTRNMYQETSSRAVELASELDSLQKVFEPTKSKLEVCCSVGISCRLFQYCGYPNPRSLSDATHFPEITPTQDATQALSTHNITIANPNTTHSTKSPAASTNEKPIPEPSSSKTYSRKCKTYEPSARAKTE